MSVRDTPNEQERDRLIRATTTVIETITSPGFMEKMREARARAEANGGLDELAGLLSISGLREAGADIPDDFRLTSRVFEDRVGGLKLDIETSPRREPGEEPVPVPMGGCAGGGAASVCGCAGWTLEAR